MFIVVGQEIYDDSPFTKKYIRIMNEDVNTTYVVILICFLVGNGCLFIVLWTWLRIRVTDRMKQLKNKIQKGSQNDKHKEYQSSNLANMEIASENLGLRRNSMTDISLLSQKTLNNTASGTSLQEDFMFSGDMVNDSPTKVTVKRRTTAYFMADIVDKATFLESSVNLKDSKVDNKKKKKKVVNEIDELEDAMLLLFSQS